MVLCSLRNKIVIDINVYYFYNTGLTQFMLQINSEVKEDEKQQYKAKAQPDDRHVG